VWTQDGSPHVDPSFRPVSVAPRARTTSDSPPSCRVPPPPLPPRFRRSPHPTCGLTAGPLGGSHLYWVDGLRPSVDVLRPFLCLARANSALALHLFGKFLVTGPCPRFGLSSSFRVSSPTKPANASSSRAGLLVHGVNVFTSPILASRHMRRIATCNRLCLPLPHWTPVRFPPFYPLPLYPPIFSWENFLPRTTLSSPTPQEVITFPTPSPSSTCFSDEGPLRNFFVALFSLGLALRAVPLLLRPVFPYTPTTRVPCPAPF